MPQTEPFMSSVARYQDMVRSVIDEGEIAEQIGAMLLVETRDGETGSALLGNALHDNVQFQKLIDELREKSVYRYGLLMNVVLADSHLTPVEELSIQELDELIDEGQEVLTLTVADPENAALYVASLTRHEDGTAELGEWTRSNPGLDPYIIKLRRAVCPQG